MRRLILFLHGLGGSDEESWGRFRELVAADPQLSDFDTGFISQPSSIWRSWVSPVATTIETLAEGLATELVEHWSEYDHILLVTHSMGGLVARKWLVTLSMRNERTNVAAIVFFAVPHEGSMLARFAVRLSSDHKQLAQLRPRSPFITQLNRSWMDLNCADRIPMWNVRAARDACVSSESSEPLWMKARSRTVNGRDHRTVIKPSDMNDTSYVVVRNAALEMSGTSVIVDATAFETPSPSSAAPVDSAVPSFESAEQAQGSLSGNPLFWTYTAADEGFYYVRQGDRRLEQILPYRNFWLHGSAGSGKTACVTRSLTRYGQPFRQISLGSAAGGDLDHVLSAFERQLLRNVEANDIHSEDRIDRIVNLLNEAAADGLTALLIEEIPLGDMPHGAFFGAVRAIVIRHAAQAPGVPVRLLFTSMVSPGREFDGNDLASESLTVFPVTDWSGAELEALIHDIAPALGIALEEGVVGRVLSSQHVSPRFIKMFLGNLLALDPALPASVDDALAATIESLAT